MRLMSTNSTPKQPTITALPVAENDTQGSRLIAERRRELTLPQRGQDHQGVAKAFGEVSSVYRSFVFNAAA
jgi:hypothetical protein